MIEYDRFSWWGTTFTWKGTALPLSFSRVLIATLYCVLFEVIYQFGTHTHLFKSSQVVELDPFGHTVLGSLIGFLIVFRINASSARYWEGRSAWGQIINASRNLVRAGTVHTQDGIELAGLVTGYAICLRRSLRGFRDTQEAELYLSSEVRTQAESFGNPPTGVAVAISSWIAKHRRAGTIEPTMVLQMESHLSAMVDAQGGCEKIQRTPLPFVYVAMIKQLILVYLATLPLVLCVRFGWWSPLLMAVLSLGMLGLEEASVEIEDPFGTHANCLDLEAYTLTIARDTGQLADLSARKNQDTPV